MSVEELSTYLDVPIRTLYDWRSVGPGPCPIHVGRQLCYFVSDVKQWLADQCELRGGVNAATD
ncbi:helix-turn-helix domain-containing protein [Aeromicrobium sp. 636]|uniref:Helix-turn-helix domain-containing protein n=2 Tax=Nocardioidaceae TaxID=85015 RepID=A0A8I0JZB7_9ACTN|nr:helix-turn-helix domain-containing protein [Aeromicrobium senzhongii]MCQ3997236.1 helix-turn-helix domain-containing protein [Aeromicrobium sp. 636]